MLLLSFCIWGIVLYSLKVGLFGNPTYHLLEEASPTLIQEAGHYLEGEVAPDDEQTYSFIKRFFRLTILASFLFFLELSVTLYFIIDDPTMSIPWIVLLKNIIMFWLGYHLQNQKDEEEWSVFERVQDIPPWARRWERISSAITAVCFLYFFLIVNNVLL